MAQEASAKAALAEAQAQATAAAKAAAALAKAAAKAAAALATAAAKAAAALAKAEAKAKARAAARAAAVAAAAATLELQTRKIAAQVTLWLDSKGMLDKCIDSLLYSGSADWQETSLDWLKRVRMFMTNHMPEDEFACMDMEGTDSCAPYAVSLWGLNGLTWTWALNPFPEGDEATLLQCQVLSLSLSCSLFLSLELFVFRAWLRAPKPQTLNTGALRVPPNFSAIISVYHERGSSCWRSAEVPAKVRGLGGDAPPVCGSRSTAHHFGPQK